MYENLLPLGSVVLLKGASKRVMICGRIQARSGDKKVYDYSACVFPEGIIRPRHMFFFDHEAIERLYFIGFQDEEELSFRANQLAPLSDLHVDDDGMIRQG